MHVKIGGPDIVVLSGQIEEIEIGAKVDVLLIEAYPQNFLHEGPTGVGDDEVYSRKIMSDPADDHRI